MQIPRLITCLLLLFTLVPPAHPAEEKAFSVNGVVKDLRSDSSVVIQHEEIPGFMAAMTMPFTPANPQEAVHLRAGDRVRFRLRVSESIAVIDQIVVTGREDPQRDSSPPPASPARRRLKAGDPVPPFALVNENGEAFTEKSFTARRTVMTFIFTRCAVPQFCPMMAQRFGELQDRLIEKGRDDVTLLSVTLDPEFDRPSILKTYGEAIGADPAHWRFLTGDKAQVEALAKAFAVFTERNGVTLDHTLCTALIDADGRVVELWRGNGWSVDDVLQALSDHPGVH